jgi:Arylsulfotransferase (ASST)
LRRILTSAVLIVGIAAPPGAAQGHPPARPGGPAAAADAEKAEKLKSLGYSAWSDAGASPDASGVTRYDPKRASAGYNLYTDYTDAAYLMDMKGRIVHTWTFPAGSGVEREFAALLPDGSLLTLGKPLVKQAWDSSEIWRVSAKLGHEFTHDLEVLKDGSLLALSLKNLDYNGYPVKMESIEHLSRDRTLQDSWSTFTAMEELRRFHPPTRFDGEGDATAREYYNKANVHVDYYHANTLRVLPETAIGRKDRRFRKGNWLICLRQVSLVAILDQDTRKVVWGWGPGSLDHPHSPVMLPDGQILIFDNGMDRGYSRLVKMNPTTGRITWTYEGKPRSDFFTAERGFVQPLPNGNMLVTLSGNGQALEITADGEVVWEFFHPERQENARRSLYRMVRYPAAMVDRLLRATAGSPATRPPPPPR